MVLIFEVKSKKGPRYIVPQYLLGECRDDIALELVLLHKKMSHSFTISYPRYMPVSKFLRLISWYSSEHVNNLYWKNGLVFFKDCKTVFVKCINTIEERKIVVSVQDNDRNVVSDVLDRIIAIDPSEVLQISIDEKNFVHLDANGLPLSVHTSSASPHEITLVEATIDQTYTKKRPRRFIRDRAYANNPFGQKHALKGVELIAPHKK